MRRGWYVMCLLVLSLGCKSESLVKNVGQLECHPQMIEFGEVEVGEPLEGTVEILNRTDRTVRFEELIRSCGCTGASIEPQEIAPGAKAFLKISLEPSINRDSSVVTIVTDSRQREISVPVLWRCVGELEAEPRVISFGDVVVGKLKEKSIELFGDNSLQWDALRVQAFPEEDLSATIVNSRCDVRLRPQESGTTRGTVRITRGESADVLLEIPVVWNSHDPSSSRIGAIANFDKSSLDGKPGRVKVLFLSPESVDQTHWVIVGPNGADMHATFVRRNAKSVWSTFACDAKDAKRTYSLISGSSEALVEFTVED